MGPVAYQGRRPDAPVTGGFVSAAIVAPLMLAAASVVVFVLTGLFDRHDRADRKR